ncbi:hypothetical protein ACIA8I_32525 [Streptomyces rishiriensis]|uniref:hypothetical protein n=1 Tax=Streptomyces rishiriensis TaxID=68264 RepID=UPI00379566BD
MRDSHLAQDRRVLVVDHGVGEGFGGDGVEGLLEVVIRAADAEVAVQHLCVAGPFVRGVDPEELDGGNVFVPQADTGRAAPGFRPVFGDRV